MRRLKLFFLLFFPVFSLNTGAQEVKFSKEEVYKSQSNFEPRVSNKYFRGKNLIYDCYDKHFVCASDLDFDECTEERQEALDNRRVILPCAPLKRMPDQISCFKLNYTLIHQQTYKGFCISQKKLD